MIFGTFWIRQRQGWLGLCLLLWGFLSLDSLEAASPREILDEAVREYQSALDSTDRQLKLARFRRAELLFASLAEGGLATEDRAGQGDSGIRNADLYVNLGNAALGGERLGQAILAYRRALLLDSNHQRALQNLAHARTLLPDWVPKAEPVGLFGTFFAWNNWLSQSQRQLLAAGVFLLAAILIACSIRWRQSALRALAVILAIVWILLMILPSDTSGDAAVVILPEVVARSADSTGAPPRLPQPLPGGTELEVLETRDDWIRVRLFDGRDPWLPASAVQYVSLP